MRKRRRAVAKLREVSGAVLAGGESRRMGRDKAWLRIAGEPLWRRQVNVLRAAGAEPVWVVRRRGQRGLSGEISHVWDAWENAGPLAGLEAALTAATGRWARRWWRRRRLRA